MIHDGWMLAVAVAAVLAGTTLQRVSGMGVGLVVAPVFALLFGPRAGVVAVNWTTIASASVMMIAARRDIEWRRAGWLLLAAAPGAALGALLVRVATPASLQVAIGAIVLVAILVTQTAPGLPELRGPGATTVTGLVAGVFNSTAGVAAPALVVYSRLARWEQRPFAATLQPIFLGLGIMSVAGKAVAGASGFEEAPPWWSLPVIVVLVLAGLGLGTLLRRRVTGEGAQRLAIALAGLGGLGVLARGIVALATGTE